MFLVREKNLFQVNNKHLITKLHS